MTPSDVLCIWFPRLAKSSPVSLIDAEMFHQFSAFSNNVEHLKEKIFLYQSPPTNRNSVFSCQFYFATPFFQTFYPLV